MNWSLLYWISEWVIRLVMLVYVPRQRSAAASRTWLLLIFLLPWPGLLFYMVVGRIQLPKNRLDSQRRALEKTRLVQEQMFAAGGPRPTLPASVSSLASLATRLGDFEPLGGNKVELLTDYDASLDRLVADIDAATRHVHLLYYIFDDDQTGHRVAEALERAILRGVKCRVMMDAVGSKRGLGRLARRMRGKGIEVIALLPVGLFRFNSARFDLRNHRKIAVVDGRIAYAGSQNITDGHFVAGFPNEEMVARISGPLAWQLQAVFLADRFLETDSLLEEPSLFPEPERPGAIIGQVMPSGPGFHRPNSEELMMNLLYAARGRVVMVTPYFVPDEPFLAALLSAARRGVDVRLVLSAHANQRLTQLAQRSYYEQLLEGGVVIHLYEPRFLHAKFFTIDGEIALIGSANIDIRSFALNAEIETVFYDAGVVAELRRIQEGYFARSTTLTAEHWSRRPLTARTLQNIARLADSFL